MEKIYIIQLIAFFILGVYFNVIVDKIIKRRKDKSIIKDVNLQFQKILDNIVSNKSSFTNRINSTVLLRTKLDDYGDINIVYLLDKKDVAIFKEAKCIYTSELASKDIITSIINTINYKYSNDINDVVELLGFTFSKDDFEKRFKIKLDDIKHGMETPSDIEDIVQNNKYKLDIDEILDRISKVGLENLTTEEKEFLNNLNK